MWRFCRLGANSLEARNRQVSVKSKLGEAIRYALTRCEGLTLFGADLDNNTVERSIRPLVLARKNALFAKAAITRWCGQI